MTKRLPAYDGTGSRLWVRVDLLGYFCLLWGLGFACMAGMVRMPDVRDRIVCRVQFPVRFAVIMMLVLFWNSHIAHDPAADMYQIRRRKLPAGGHKLDRIQLAPRSSFPRGGLWMDRVLRGGRRPHRRLFPELMPAPKTIW
jgi:hypothetical protein